MNTEHAEHCLDLAIQLQALSIELDLAQMRQRHHEQLRNSHFTALEPMVRTDPVVMPNGAGSSAVQSSDPMHAFPRGRWT